MPRQLQLGNEHQRPDERVAYQLTIDSSYASPGSAACTLYDVTTGTATEVASKLSGSPAIVGQVFTSPLVIDLVAGSTYRLEFKFTSGGNTFEPYLLIVGVA